MPNNAKLIMGKLMTILARCPTCQSRQPIKEIKMVCGSKGMDYKCLTCSTKFSTMQILAATIEQQKIDHAAGGNHA